MKLNEHIFVKPDISGVKLIIVVKPGETIEIELTHDEAHRLGKLLLSYSKTARIQINSLLRKIAELERKIAVLEEKAKQTTTQ